MNTKILDTMTKVEEKVSLIDSLIEINKAVNLQENQSKKLENNKLQKLEPNQTDKNYENLNCEIESLPEESDEFKMLKTYCDNTN
jgi:hypothetical protein